MEQEFQIDARAGRRTETNPRRLVSAATIAHGMDCSMSTVRRWAKAFAWDKYACGPRLVRYDAEQVRETLGVELWK